MMLLLPCRPSSGLIVLLAFIVLLGEIDFFATLNWRLQNLSNLTEKYVSKVYSLSRPPGFGE
jgi:hypothetical protein